MAHRLPLAGEPAAPATRPWPIAGKGFRPFFLLAGLFAAIVVPGWLLVLDGRLQVGGYLDPVSWHAHEMVFGFAVAVIAGFLLTAVGNWTNRETIVGLPLLALAAVWVAGRVAVSGASSLPPWSVAAIDLAFLPALIAVIARPLIATRNTRNFVMMGILAALFAANLAVHLDVLGVLPGWRLRGSRLGVDVVVLVILVMSGRTFPMFTRNATGAEAIASSPRLDRLALAAMAALVVLDAAAPDVAVTAAWSAVVGAIALARSWGWGAWQARKNPLLWILHVGYLWIPVGLILRGVARLTDAVPASIATHALTVGAIGCLTLGMMARVALGHSGRTLATPRPMVVAFAFAILAAVVRISAPIIGIAHYRATLYTAGTLWTAAFALFLLVYVPILVTPRVDGRPG